MSELYFQCHPRPYMYILYHSQTWFHVRSSVELTLSNSLLNNMAKYLISINQPSCLHRASEIFLATHKTTVCSEECVVLEKTPQRFDFFLSFAARHGIGFDRRDDIHNYQGSTIRSIDTLLVVVGITLRQSDNYYYYILIILLYYPP